MKGVRNMSKLKDTNKKIENGVVSGYKKIEDKFVDKYLKHDGETIEEAKIRLKKEEKARKEKQEKEMAERKAKIEAKTNIKK